MLTYFGGRTSIDKWGPHFVWPPRRAHPSSSRPPSHQQQRRGPRESRNHWNAPAPDRLVFVNVTHKRLWPGSVPFLPLLSSWMLKPVGLLQNKGGRFSIQAGTTEIVTSASSTVIPGRPFQLTNLARVSSW